MACGCSSCAAAAAGQIMPGEPPPVCDAVFSQSDAAAVRQGYPTVHSNPLLAAASLGRQNANFGCPPPATVNVGTPGMSGTTPMLATMTPGAARDETYLGGYPTPAGQLAPSQAALPIVPIVLSFAAGALFWATVYGKKSR